MQNSHARVFHTANGTAYLKEPGIVLISRPAIDPSGLHDFLQDWGYEDYLHDPDAIESGAQLCKVAGQLCYMSFGKKRTWNKDANKYFENIKSSGHGSVLEHANYTFLLYGISRSLTHELVRHRHFSYSQVSQRYVPGDHVRFVERPEWQHDEHLHAWFERRIDKTIRDYEDLTDILFHDQSEGSMILSGEKRTDLKKKVRQAARSVLPNETEAPLIMTGNVRAWRHFVEVRACEHAEIEMRQLAVKVFYRLRDAEPVLFSDYQLDTLNDDTQAVSTPYRKV
jgi:thymidylate synthase (FAD)